VAVLKILEQIQLLMKQTAGTMMTVLRQPSQLSKVHQLVDLPVTVAYPVLAEMSLYLLVREVEVRL